MTHETMAAHRVVLRTWEELSSHFDASEGSTQTASAWIIFVIVGVLLAMLTTNRLPKKSGRDNGDE